MADEGDISTKKLEVLITFLIALVSVTSTVVGYFGSDAYGSESREHSRGLEDLSDANAVSILATEKVLMDNQYVLQSSIYYKSYLRLNGQVYAYEHKAEENETNGNHTIAGELRVVAENLRNEAERMKEIFNALDSKTMVPIRDYMNNTSGEINLAAWRVATNAATNITFAEAQSMKNESDMHFRNATKYAEKGNNYLFAGTILSLSTLMSAVALVAPRKDLKIAFIFVLLATYTIGAAITVQTYISSS
jgi:hypothetical protein